MCENQNGKNLGLRAKLEDCKTRMARNSREYCSPLQSAESGTISKASMSAAKSNGGDDDKDKPQSKRKRSQNVNIKQERTLLDTCCKKY